MTKSQPPRSREDCERDANARFDRALELFSIPLGPATLEVAKFFFSQGYEAGAISTMADFSAIVDQKLKEANT